jgi:hypothetical protein
MRRIRALLGSAGKMAKHRYRLGLINVAGAKNVIVAERSSSKSMALYRRKEMA